jgi:predicted phage baseplate assembly protein
LRPGYCELYQVAKVETAARTDFTLSAKVTRLALDTNEHLAWFGLRDTVVFSQSERLELAERPETTPLSGDRIVLGGPAPTPALQRGQALALTGRPAGAAVPAAAQSEIVFVKSTSDDGAHTTVTLAAPLQRTYDPATVTLNANVARATHGETVRDEPLGSGSGALANQRFTLKKPPLTYVSASMPSGAASTLEVRVDDVLWNEVPSLFGRRPADQSYVVRQKEGGATRLIFGDGIMGARLPTGAENVRATYRSGLGPEGNVPAERLTLLLTRPFGVRGVTNPLPAAGGAAPEQLDDARANAPLTVLTLDRIVSLRDFEDFARAFAGIGKAKAARLWDGRRNLIHVTVAGVGGAPVEDNPTLLANLRRAIDGARDPVQKVQVGGFVERRFGVAAEVLVDPRHVPEQVLAAAARTLEAVFSFARRDFGQPITAAEVIAALQGVPGILAVDLNALDLVAGGAAPSGPAASRPATAGTAGTPAPPGAPPFVSTGGAAEAGPPAFLPVALARVERGQILPAQLLLLDPAAVRLAQLRLPA